MLLVLRLLAECNEAFIAKILLDSMQEGLIAMIPKSETAASDPAAYRPITMINPNIKVLAKILAVRLANEVTHLIHSDQCGFIPRPNTSMNVRRLMHVL
ncbi:hypothetical protein NDU88_000887 [Pleurodeles waltl]|uniref:Reverse transcriptase domain-containing protein n=1 Tax=Pleurodeles waltl TaxID=8319 RepID=A0AAV7LW11_PLEWA|nr:hypothetical protein NDU88_000887 [Pleurodeles waltl]